MKNDRFGKPGSHKADRFGGLAYRHLIEYRTWSHMIARCYNPKHRVYHHYGGRGIRVCRRWRHNFVAFFKDVGPRPKGRFCLDRIDNSKGYSPANVRWTTQAVQMQNTRHTRLLTHQGRTLSLSAWAREVGIGLESLRKRLRNGWSVAKAVTTPRLPGKAPSSFKRT